MLISHIASKFAASYHTLQPRLTKTLLRTFLDPLKGRGALFGAAVALGGMGEEVVVIHILLFHFVEGYFACSCTRSK